MDLWFSRLTTNKENLNKESTSYSEEVKFEVSHSHSSSMDTELFLVISLLNTPPTDTALRDQLHGSDKVKGFWIWKWNLNREKLFKVKNRIHM